MVEKIGFNMQNIFKLADIEKGCFGKDAWSISALRGEFCNEFSHFFGAVENAEIVGYVCVRIMCEEAQICNICVLDKHRRQGHASALLAQVAEFAKENGCERCELEVNTANTPAVELYKKCGYDVAGIRPNFYRRSRYATRDAYTMVLQLIK
ncbi:MAG: ribosomal protein S18-alanine N-acetyltransferase [Clostridia bacterium]|nr:ribosomal protein S18-alanine N-acetyltransferase [Clostridia bacterium]